MVTSSWLRRMVSPIRWKAHRAEHEREAEERWRMMRDGRLRALDAKHEARMRYLRRMRTHGSHWTEPVPPPLTRDEHDERQRLRHEGEG